MKRMIFFFLFIISSLQAEELSSLKIRENGPNPIGYISIPKDRPIDQSTYLYVKFALDHFKTLPVSFVVLELDTPGGEIFSAMKIADLLQKLDTQDHIPVIAFINNWAISAGAMLAYSCRYIGIMHTASMGAAEPVLIGQDGKVESASEKVNSALRSEMANLANVYDRNPLIAEAMVDKDLTLILRNGKIIKLEDENAILESDQIISKKGKLLTLNAKELIDYGVADFEVAKTALPEGVHLLMTHPFFVQIQEASFISYSDWKIDFFAFLCHPLVASLLMMGLMLGGYIELNHPGMIVPGLLSACCLGLILLSHFSIQTIHFLEPLIFFSGLILLLAEIFIIPGFGVIGILGIILMLFGLFTLTVPYWSEIQFSQDISYVTHFVLKRAAYFAAVIILFLSFIFLFGRPLFHRFLFRSKIILSSEQDRVDGLNSLVGSSAIAVTSLRPAGKIRIGKEMYDALSEREFIDKDVSLIVTRQEGQKIFVKTS